MADIVDKATRSRMMSRIGSKNTRPEIIVRSAIHRQGFRFRLHQKDLPGSPDIVLPKWNTVVVVHGCYWHRHSGCRLAYEVKSNADRWNRKFAANIDRDQRNYAALNEQGWNVVVAWECATRSMTLTDLGTALQKAIHRQAGLSEVPER